MARPRPAAAAVVESTTCGHRNTFGLTSILKQGQYEMEVLDPEVDQRGLGERLSKKTDHHVN